MMKHRDARVNALLTQALHEANETFRFSSEPIPALIHARRFAEALSFALLARAGEQDRSPGLDKCIQQLDRLKHPKNLLSLLRILQSVTNAAVHFQDYSSDPMSSVDMPSDHHVQAAIQSVLGLLAAVPEAGWSPPIPESPVWNGGVWTRGNSVPATSQVSRLRKVLDSRVMTVGCIQHPPLCATRYVSGRVEPFGWYVELCRLVCEAHGIEPVFLDVPWSEVATVLRDEPVDIVLSVFDTDLRREHADFTAPLHSVGLIGVSSANDDRGWDVDRLLEHDTRVVVSRGEAAWEYVTDQLQIPKRRLVVLESIDLTELATMALGASNTLVLCDAVSCSEIIRTQPELTLAFSAAPLFMYRNAVMVPKGDREFSRWINDEFRAHRMNPAIADEERRIVAETPGLGRFT